MTPDLVDLWRAFIAHEVRVLVAGAYALAVHGRPRATGDLDVWVEPSADNASRVLRALAEFGAPLSDVSAADFARPGVVFQVGLPCLGSTSSASCVASRAPRPGRRGRVRRSGRSTSTISGATTSSATGAPRDGPETARISRSWGEPPGPATRPGRGRTAGRARRPATRSMCARAGPPSRGARGSGASPPRSRARRRRRRAACSRESRRSAAA